MNWRVKRKIGKTIERLGWWLGLPFIALAWPFMALSYWGRDIAIAASRERPTMPPISDPDFKRSTIVE